MEKYEMVKVDGTDIIEGIDLPQYRQQYVYRHRWRVNIDKNKQTRGSYHLYCIWGVGIVYIELNDIFYSLKIVQLSKSNRNKNSRKGNSSSKKNLCTHRYVSSLLLRYLQRENNPWRNIYIYIYKNNCKIASKNHNLYGALLIQ